MLARRAAVLAVRSLQVQRGWSLDVAHRILQHWRPAADRSRRSQASADRSAGAAGAAAWAGSCSELGVPAAEAASIQPAVPLCERSGQHAVPLSDLLAWWEAAKQRVAAVGDSWVQQEPDGPTAADLETELGWLMDDCVAGMARAGKDWGSASWQQVERDVRTQGPLSQAACQYMVQLREPLDALDALWERRLQQRVPLQYLTSSAFWRDVVLSVGPGVLIPRPETELMIDFVEEAVAAAPALGSGVWADLGTGSGALAVGVARALPQAKQVYAVDLSPVPLAYASFNAQRLGVADRLTALQGSWYEPLQAAGVQQLAGVVSNPPYICAADMEGLQAEVGRHEPRLALCGGEGLGLDCLLPICTGAARLLQPGGFLALETAGGEQAHYIADLLRHMRRSAATDGLSASEGEEDGERGEGLAWADVRVRRDLRGVERFVTASLAA